MQQSIDEVEDEDGEFETHVVRTRKLFYIFSYFWKKLIYIFFYFALLALNFMVILKVKSRFFSFPFYNYGAS